MRVETTGASMKTARQDRLGYSGADLIKKLYKNGELQLKYKRKMHLLHWEHIHV